MIYLTTRPGRRVRLSGPGPKGTKITFAFSPDRMRRVSIPDSAAERCAEDLARLVDAGVLLRMTVATVEPAEPSEPPPAPRLPRRSRRNAEREDPPSDGQSEEE